MYSNIFEFTSSYIIKETKMIYILRLANNKWYIGKSINVQKRYQEHLNGSVSWTRKYRPIEIENTIDSDSPFDEDKYTKEYMSKYGINNVRGGSYCSINLDDEQMELLQREIWMAKNLCLRCGRNHFIKDCYAKYDVDGYKLLCNRCGRDHNTNDCYAKYDVDGNKIF